MDRATVYSQEIPRTVDFLQGEQSAMVALAKLSEMVLGTGTFVDGLTCVPTGPASLNVWLNPGQIYSLANLEATTWSAISADTTHQIVKQGIALNQQTIAITPPVTGGFSQVYLIEVQYADLDTTSVVLPYFNSANPSVPLTGPGGAGTPQNTLRSGIVSVQLKAGTAALTGTQVAPSVDAGWTGLWLITVAQGQSTITAGNIVELAGAPFIANANNAGSAKLSQVPNTVQNGSWQYAADTGTANAYAIALSPAPAALTAGMEIRFKVLNTNTGASTLVVNSLASVPITHSDGTALLAGDLAAGQIAIGLFDGTNMQLPRATVDPSTVMSTADVKWQPNAGTITGWVRINGRTIGNAVSGATEFASSTALSLYTYIWTNYSNTRCPVTGGRGSTAAADFAGGKPIQLLDMRGRSPFGLDDMGNSTAGRILNSNVTSAGDSATAAAGTGGIANHTVLASEVPVLPFVGAASTSSQQYLTAGTGTLSAEQTGAGAGLNQNTVTLTPNGTVNAASGGTAALALMNPFMLGTWYWKL